MAVVLRACAFFLLIAIALLPVLPASAQEKSAEATQAVAGLPPLTLQVIGQGTVSEVLKPDLIRLDTGSLYLLDNIRVPAVYAEQALAWLDANLIGQKITLYASPDLGEGARDRMGNQFAHAVIDSTPPRWVQGDMIASGLAWADSTVTNHNLMTELLAFEEQARTTAQGFWAAPGMAVRKADAIGNARDQFMLVTGTAVSTANKRSVFFANYGEDWKTDFTIRLNKKDLRNFPPGFNIGRLDGKPIRIRGWVSERNGPTIELTHPEQLEFLPEEDAAATAPPPAPASAKPGAHLQ